MVSPKLVKLLDNLTVIKESKDLDSARINSMIRHATETLAILINHNQSHRPEDMVQCPISVLITNN